MADIIRFPERGRAWSIRDRIVEIIREIIRDAADRLSISEIEYISGALHEAGHILHEIAIERADRENSIAIDMIGRADPRS